MNPTPELTPEAAAKAYLTQVPFRSRIKDFLAGQSYASTLAENERRKAVDAAWKEGVTVEFHGYHSQEWVPMTPFDGKNMLAFDKYEYRIPPGQFSALTARLKKVEEERDEARANAEGFRQSMYALEGQVGQRDKQMEDLRAQIAKLTAKRDQAQDMVKSQQDALGVHIADWRKVYDSLRSELTAAREELRASRQNCADFRRAAEKASKELTAANEAREKAERNFKLYRGMFTRIKDQIIGGHGPEEMLRWREALKENDKGDGKVDAVAALIAYFYKLCAAKDQSAKDRDQLKAELESARAEIARLTKRINEAHIAMGYDPRQDCDLAECLASLLGQRNELCQKLESASARHESNHRAAEAELKHEREVYQRQLKEVQEQLEFSRNKYQMLLNGITILSSSTP